MRRVLRIRLHALCLVFVVAVAGSGLQAALLHRAVGGRQLGRANTWSARSSTGLVLMGTWTATVDATTDTATGAWTLLDSQNRTVTQGTWSAAKSPTGWTGAWRAAVAGGKAAYSGEWSAGVDLKGDAPLASLFEKAVEAVVSGSWQAGGHPGTWSIRAFNRQRRLRS